MNVGIQFHSLPEELFQFVAQQVAEFSLHAVVMRYPPGEVAEADEEALHAAFADSSVYALTLTVGSPVLPPGGTVELAVQNPDSMRVDIGRRSEKGLGESWIATRASDPGVVAVWRKVIGRFKRMTHAGATAVNPNTGATCRASDHRYTDGAKALNQEGVAMLPMAGGAILRLG